MTDQIEAINPRILLDVSEESQGQTIDRENWDETDDESSSATDVGPAGGDQPDDDPETTAAEEPDPLPKDVRFDILKNRRRRLVLQYAIEHDNPVTIGTLAEHVAAIENEKDVGALNSRERKRAYVGLYQCHLPRMNDADVIDFDQNRGTVDLGVHADELMPHLLEDTEQTDNYPWLYAALSTVGAGAFLISQSAIIGANVVGTAVVGLVLTAFLGTALWQLYDERNED